jgi:hypothetical protein
MDYTCLTPGSKWKINTSIGLFSNPTTTTGIPCTIGKSCQTDKFTVTDPTGHIIQDHSGSEYFAWIWHCNTFNHIKSTFTLPTSDQWDGTIGSVNIEII